ncbi:hypothetical protein [Acidianus sp. RZ1]|nr:hypothetical protein [Acidianus sp. RZ1]NON61606.1 hypothetical protein [Acidianus sp. RZ1]
MVEICIKPDLSLGSCKGEFLEKIELSCFSGHIVRVKGIEYYCDDKRVKS